uniref:Actin-related protein 2/3 complex subunit 4 n=1 Tax=Fibrocapsa japonica TaxID=94617 RepID=A0A7S2UT47_9STRA|mmetsp:Transcript_12069/g.17793  ORF Transcript_12069/g.17793 Transcript_12069/m.17793 type:complete len:172 (+) Transcript_12069:193-708(+)|eukprot:CAMPEP_0113942448 /NCGR_PEP_ID=MMETSP1339-20121228/8160_1 /TAXON_ID=94617 /ORGANISM="Fibrocapsa japonica" /LENGTH=171 /DNA_ID=CAMNT_0000946929 /DNA_START=183 /DNA_END=698 /DNA_ORIENTATION=- /assembly_acc=CAM_ASM_000762
MAGSTKYYLEAIRSTLTAALCLRDFPSQSVERHNKPEVEMSGNKELVLNPVHICRNENERCLIEPSVNSVRVSIRIKHMDLTEKILIYQFTQFLMRRSEQFLIMRRKPIEGYHLSFLITSAHMDKMWKNKLVDFVVTFMEQMDKEINEMKISINSRGRVVASEFMKQFTLT